MYVEVALPGVAHHVPTIVGHPFGCICSQSLLELLVGNDVLLALVVQGTECQCGCNACLYDKAGTSLNNGIFGIVLPVAHHTLGCTCSTVIVADCHSCFGIVCNFVYLNVEGQADEIPFLGINLVVMYTFSADSCGIVVYQNLAEGIVALVAFIVIDGIVVIHIYFQIVYILCVFTINFDRTAIGNEKIGCTVYTLTVVQNQVAPYIPVLNVCCVETFNVIVIPVFIQFI